MIEFYILLPDEKHYCKVLARTQADAQKRAHREFGSGWEITTDKSVAKELKAVEFM
jgi:hypothetical protein